VPRPPTSSPAADLRAREETIAPRDVALDRDAQELHRALGDLLRAIQFRDRDRICCYDVSVSQCYALDALVGRGPLTMNELAAELFLDKSTSSRLVDALVAKGYAVRQPHPQDGRALQLEATEAGRKLSRRIEEDLLAEVTAVLEPVGAASRQAMTRLVGQLARAATGRIDVSSGCCRLR
jgi:MarR family transcriptional regulator, 2-MHQ and catechol-resistance regulon repressor